MKRMSAAAFTCVLVLLALIHAQTSAVSAQGSVQACMNPNSGELKVQVSASCAPGWVSVTLSTGGGDGRGPRVVDSADQDVGALLVPGAPEYVLRYVAPYWLMMRVGVSGFLTGWGTIFYLTDNCTGQAYIDIPTGGLARNAYLRDDGILYHAGEQADVTPHSAQGIFANGSLTSCFSSTDGFFGSFGPAMPVDPDTFGLTPPFRIVDP